MLAMTQSRRDMLRQYGFVLSSTPGGWRVIDVRRGSYFGGFYDSELTAYVDALIGPAYMVMASRCGGDRSGYCNPLGVLDVRGSEDSNPPDGGAE